MIGNRQQTITDYPHRMEISSLSASNAELIELLRKQYLQLLEPDLLAIPGPDMLRRPEVQHLLYEEMFHSENLKFAPDSRYQLRVLKKVISRIESSIADPDQDVGFP